jgi:hypothetical protein
MSCNSFWHHVSTVDRKRIQQARLVAKNAFEKAGAPINEVALDLAEEMAGDQRFRQLLDDPNQIARASVVAGFLLWAEEYVDVPDEQWANFLQKMEQELPYGLRPGLKKGLKDLAKGLPKRPSTGRHEILDTRQKRKKACDLVSKIERSGVSKRQAYAKAAREMNCSARTIQRAWQARGRG